MTQNQTITTRILNWPAIILGHIGILLLATLFWDFRALGPLEKILDLYVMEGRFYIAKKETESLIKYFSLTAVLLIALVQFLSIKACKHSGQSYIQSLANFSRSLWPTTFALLAIPLSLPMLADPIDSHHKFTTLLTILTLSMTVGMLLQKFCEIKSAANPKPKLAPSQKWLWFSLAATLAYIGWFAYITIMRHVTIQTNLHDFSLYDQTMWNIVNGNGWRCTLWQIQSMGYDLKAFDYNWNAEHFMPTFLLLAPAYWLFQNPITLLFLQALGIGLAAVPLYFIALNKTKSSNLGFIFVLAYLLHPLVTLTNVKEFHMDAFIPLFLLSAYAFFLHKRWVPLRPLHPPRPGLQRRCLTQRRRLRIIHRPRRKKTGASDSPPSASA